MKLCSYYFFIASLLTTLGTTSSHQRGLRRDHDSDESHLRSSSSNSNRALQNNMNNNMNNNNGNNGNGNGPPPPPFEPAQNSCVKAEDAFLTPSDFGGEFGNGDFATGLAEFKAMCDVGGSCFAGEVEGCCRITNKNGMECDNEREFASAVCICNEFTSPSRSDIVQNSNNTVDVDNSPTTSPAPSLAPTSVNQNCQRFNSSRTDLNGFDNPWPDVIAQFSGADVTGCFGDDDCPSATGIAGDDEGCCLRSFCICVEPNFPIPGLLQGQCTGPKNP